MVGLELYLLHFSLYVFVRQTQIYSRSIDVPVAELLLKSIQPAATVQEVDSIPMAK